MAVYVHDCFSDPYILYKSWKDKTSTVDQLSSRIQSWDKLCLFDAILFTLP
jgi:hypothetical protein